MTTIRDYSLLVILAMLTAVPVMLTTPGRAISVGPFLLAVDAK